MVESKQELHHPEIIVNGARIDVTDPIFEHDDTEPSVTTTITFRIGGSGPTPLYFIGSQVSVQVDEFGPSTFRVVGIDEDIQDKTLPYRIRLREVRSAHSFQDTLNILYGTVFQTIMNRVRMHAIVDTLVQKNLLNDVEFSNRLLDVADRFLVQYAADIVSDSDAIAMREYVVNQLKQGITETEQTDPSRDR